MTQRGGPPARPRRSSSYARVRARAPSGCGPVSADIAADQGERRAWGWVHAPARRRDHAVGGVGRAAVTPVGRSCPAPSSSSCSAGSTLAGPVVARCSSTGCSTPAPSGRGRPDLELVGAVEASPFGPRPVDPADLPADELLRVATGRARRGPGRGRPAAAPPTRRGARGPGARATGWSATRCWPARSAPSLIARGRPPGRPAPTRRGAARRRPRPDAGRRLDRALLRPGRAVLARLAPAAGRARPAARPRADLAAGRPAPGRAGSAATGCTSSSTPRAARDLARRARAGRAAGRRRRPTVPSTWPAGSRRCWPARRTPTSGTALLRPDAAAAGWRTHRGLPLGVPARARRLGARARAERIAEELPRRWLRCARRPGRPAAGRPRDGRGAVRQPATSTWRCGCCWTGTPGRRARR